MRHGYRSFNLNRDARPLATPLSISGKSMLKLFQSQPRCQAPGDKYYGAWLIKILRVSISTEMPGPWRPSVRGSSHPMLVCFNLNRDARPLATAMGLAWLWKPFYAIVCEAEVENAHKRYFSTIC